MDWLPIHPWGIPFILIGIALIIYGYRRSRPREATGVACYLCGKPTAPDEYGGMFYLGGHTLCRQCYRDWLKRV